MRGRRAGENWGGVGKGRSRVLENSENFLRVGDDFGYTVEKELGNDLKKMGRVRESQASRFFYSVVM